MSNRARVILTVVFGFALGVSIWTTDSVLDGAVFLGLILVPLIVGRWWVVTALAGLAIGVATFRLTGHVFRGGSDGDEWGLLWGVVGLTFWGFVFLVLVGIRKAFDYLRRRRATRNSLDVRAIVSSGSDF